MEQSIGRSWVFVGISREIWDLRDGTPLSKGTPFEQGNAFRSRERLSSKGTPFQIRKNTNKQGKNLSSKVNAFQARGIFRSNVKVCKW
nr:MAG TPA: hypothetical protein [Caudoviricetes sp.]